MPGVARGWHTVYTSDGYLLVAQLFRKCTLIPPKAPVGTGAFYFLNIPQRPLIQTPIPGTIAKNAA
jgi:hypothetical protein